PAPSQRQRHASPSPWHTESLCGLIRRLLISPPTLRVALRFLSILYTSYLRRKELPPRPQRTGSWEFVPHSPPARWRTAQSFRSPNSRSSFAEGTTFTTPTSRTRSARMRYAATRFPRGHLPLDACHPRQARPQCPPLHARV